MSLLYIRRILRGIANQHFRSWYKLRFKQADAMTRVGIQKGAIRK